MVAAVVLISSSAVVSTLELEDVHRCTRWPSVLLQRRHWHHSERQASEFPDEDTNPPEAAEEVAVGGLMDSSLLEKQLSTSSRMFSQSIRRQDPEDAGLDDDSETARPGNRSHRMVVPIKMDTTIVDTHHHLGHMVQKELVLSNAKMRKWLSRAFANLTAKISAISTKLANTSNTERNTTLGTPCYWPAPMRWLPPQMQLQPAGWFAPPRPPQNSHIAPTAVASFAEPLTREVATTGAVGVPAQQLQAVQLQVASTLPLAMPASMGTAPRLHIAAWPPQQRVLPVSQARLPLTQQFASFFRWR